MDGAEEGYRYAIAIVDATRRHADVGRGASPRATVHLIRAAKAMAALDKRDYVLPDDVADLAVSVLAHRVLPSTEAQLARRSVSEILTKAVQSAPVPDKG